MNIKRPNLIVRYSLLYILKHGKLVFKPDGEPEYLKTKDGDYMKDADGQKILKRKKPPVWVRILWWIPVINIIPLWIEWFINRRHYVEIYDTYVIRRSGVLNKRESKKMFPNVLSLNMNRSFWGRLFKFGNISINAIGDDWNINFEGIKNPLLIRRYIERHFIPAKDVKALRQTFISR